MSRHAHAFWHREKSWHDVKWRDVLRLSGSTAQHVRRDKRDTQQKHTAEQMFCYKRVVYCFGSCITLKSFLLFSPKNVIDAVQSKGNLYQVGSLRMRMTIVDNVFRQKSYSPVIGNGGRRSDWRGQIFDYKLVNRRFCACAVKICPKLDYCVVKSPKV